jgi:phage-related protein
MIFNINRVYKIKFYIDLRTKRMPVLDYIASLEKKDRAKILKFIDFLRENDGYLEEPYTKHIKGEIRELRVDFASNRHRIFYFSFVGRNIILLHAFLKHTQKTPLGEIKKAEENYFNVIKNRQIYE